MKPFLDENFLLTNPAAQRIYHNYAKALPIIDYHCHLDPKQAADNVQFHNISQLWLAKDHYKWRLMRACGVKEEFITGKNTSDYEKFLAFAQIIPLAIGNPIYHWVHMELKTAFGITTLLKPSTAKDIYEQCNAQLQTPDLTAIGLMQKYKVEIACTTDDPADTLEYHLKMKQNHPQIKLLPTWRPDKAANIANPHDFRIYIEQLSAAANINIYTFDDLMLALQVRHDFFDQTGCRLSDHGLGEFPNMEYTQAEISKIFAKVLGGSPPSIAEELKFKSCLLYEGAIMDHKAGWTQQFHYGALRNTNPRLYKTLGADAGGDSIGDWNSAQAISAFLAHLEAAGNLTKTIFYNLNPADNAMLAAMTGNFQNGDAPSTIQYGAAWWFADHKDGIEEQLKTLAATGVLSQFIGMLTDSRSFLSYPRHDYFRRILCNYLGKQIEDGLLPASEEDFIGQIAANICYYNAKNYFNF